MFVDEVVDVFFVEFIVFGVFIVIVYLVDDLYDFCLCVSIVIFVRYLRDISFFVWIEKSSGDYDCEYVEV